MDAELSPSEEDIDSVANDPEVEPEEEHPGLPEGGRVVGVLDLNRNLRPDISWICLGLDREKNEVHLFVPDGDWPSIFEMRGFVDMVANPEFILSRLKTTGEG